ncbi:MAG: DUF2062 domain-containing protein [Lentisphaeria bacterium]|nr:DUF2062 domain-containing protein [Lentisphaeria bacterium]
MKKFSLRRLYFKVMQQEGTPESVGRGIAIGLFIGFILPIGTQTFPALFLAFLFKANKALTWLFTCVSNPASIFILYPIQCYTGSLLIMRPMSFADLNDKFGAIVQADGMKEVALAFWNLGSEIMITFFVGGLFYGTILAVAGYWTGSRLVRLYRKRKEKKRQERRLNASGQQEAGPSV